MEHPGSRLVRCDVTDVVHVPKVRRPDTTRAEALLDWRPTVPSEEGLRRTVEWFATVLRSRGARAG